jgi:hypothetical protein
MILKSIVILANMASLLAILDSVPRQFSWDAALMVGAITAITVVVVIGIALASPFIALQLGATLLGTVVAVGVAAICVGVVSGSVAGLHWGGIEANEKAAELEDKREEIAVKSAKLHIFFIASANDATQAVDFECMLLMYDEININQSNPMAQKNTKHITAENADVFYQLIGKEMEDWVSTVVQNDIKGISRKVIIYMTPNPGEGIYERLRDMAKNLSKEPDVSRIEGSWEKASSE